MLLLVLLLLLLLLLPLAPPPPPPPLLFCCFKLAVSMFAGAPKNAEAAYVLLAFGVEMGAGFAEDRARRGRLGQG